MYINTVNVQPFFTSRCMCSSVMYVNYRILLLALVSYPILLIFLLATFSICNSHVGILLKIGMQVKIYVLCCFGTSSSFLCNLIEIIYVKETRTSTDWQTDWMADWFANWPTDQPTEWLTGWRSDWPNDNWLINKLTDQPVDWPTILCTNRPNNRKNDEPTDC